MYQIHGVSIPSNTTKTIYIAEALGIDYEYIQLDFSTGENRTAEHLKRHPLGKLPTLTHDGKTLFESNAICGYLTSVENSNLYPKNDDYYRACIDQWLAFFTNHLGRWLTVYGFEKITKGKIGLGAPNKAAVDEALKFIKQQIPCVNDQLSKDDFFVGNQLSLADYIAFAYFENAEMAEFSLSDYSAVANWYENIKSSDVIKRAHLKLGMSIS